ncbi:MAG TPA: TetR/AcrR family transcriptional regulator [Steroidobacteraceae bacterium]|nr:TetR/AcrR family transcriptional regulator [Steroidobacteraceae bacterium]
MSELTARRQEERDRRRSEIIDAAAAAASDGGFDAITMDQIARRARLSRGLLYVYFEDKDALHLALCERAMELLLERFAAATQDVPTGLARLEAIGSAYVRYARELPVYFQALAHLEARAPEDLQKHLRSTELGMLCHQRMTGAIRDGIADGSIRPDLGSPDAVAIALWGFMHGVIQIANTKGALLVLRNTDTLQLYEQALALMRRALSTVP